PLEGEAETSFRLTNTAAGGEPRTLVFDQDLVTIGRDAKCDVMLEDMLVSRRHAEIKREEAIYALVDAGTQNGTLLNGRRVQGMALLNGGDGIAIGKFRIRFEADAQVPAAVKAALDENVEELGNMTLRMTPETEKRVAEEAMGRVKGYVVVSKKGGGPELRRFVAETFVIGKAPECDLALRGWLVPKKAAIIVRGADKYLLLNLAASPGQIVVNGVPVPERVVLEDCARVQVFGESFMFEIPPEKS
ncbi:MAG: FHA domain-containing protein, partial [Planctomycetota bacterium]